MDGLLLLSGIQGRVDTSWLPIWSGSFQLVDFVHPATMASPLARTLLGRVASQTADEGEKRIPGNAMGSSVREFAWPSRACEGLTVADDEQQERKRKV